MKVFLIDSVIFESVKSLRKDNFSYFKGDIPILMKLKAGFSFI